MSRLHTYLYFLVTALFVMLYSEASAIKSRTNIIKYIQPDGSVVLLKMYGDEFFGYSRTLGGELVATAGDGYLQYIGFSGGRRFLSGKRLDNKVLNLLETGTFSDTGVPDEDASHLRKCGLNALFPSFTTKNNRENKVVINQFSYPFEHRSEGAKEARYLVLPVEFKDVEFSLSDPLGYFSRMLNSSSFSENGAAGSVSSYLNENFGGVVNFTFDLGAIIQLPNEREFYGGHTQYLNDANVAAMVVEACKMALEQGIDFSRYDTDSDGIVDNVAIIFAGHNEAESGISQAIWPHKGDISDKNIICNGVKIASYTCSSEYSGGNDLLIPATIGTFCHEFCHALGLPDLYDVNGSEEGDANALYGKLSIMDQGNYNDEGRRPPYFNVVERELLGLAEVVELEPDGEYALLPVNSSESIGRISSSNENEYFLLECRTPQGWDTPLGCGGMVLYHIDKSQNSCGGVNAATRWKLNIVNSYAEHECCRVVAASEVADGENLAPLFFPGTGDVRRISLTSSPSLKDWNNAGLGIMVTDIDYDTKEVRFKTRQDIQYVDSLPYAASLALAVYQKSAYMSWSAPDSLKGLWRVVVKPADGSHNIPIQYTREKRCRVDSLRPGCSYNLSVIYRERYNMGKEVEQEFITGEITSEYPYIKIDGERRAGAQLSFDIMNLVERYDSIFCLLDGKPLEEHHFILEREGDYHIEVRINYPDGSTDSIIKLIQVK